MNYQIVDDHSGLCPLGGMITFVNGTNPKYVISVSAKGEARGVIIAHELGHMNRGHLAHRRRYISHEIEADTNVSNKVSLIKFLGTYLSIDASCRVLDAANR